MNVVEKLYNIYAMVDKAIWSFDGLRRMMSVMSTNASEYQLFLLDTNSYVRYSTAEVLLIRLYAILSFTDFISIRSILINIINIWSNISVRIPSLLTLLLNYG